MPVAATIQGIDNLIRRGATVLTIRIPKAEWAKAWRAMIEVAPVRLIKNDPLYEVLPAHLEILNVRGFRYEIVQSTPRPFPHSPSLL